MFILKNFQKKKVINLFIIFISFPFIVGFFNTSWISLFAWILLFLCIYAFNPRVYKNKYSIIIFLCLFSLMYQKLNIYPKISEKSNVFIGGEKYDNSIFKKELPTKVYQKLNEDFIKTFPESIAAPDKKLYRKSASNILFTKNETRSVSKIDWDNRYQLLLRSFNNTAYNAYGIQQPSRDNLPFFVNYTFPSYYNKTNAKLCWVGQAYISNLSFKELIFKNKECIKVKDYVRNQNNKLSIWFIETGLSPPLKVEFKNSKKNELITLLMDVIKIVCLIYFLRLNYTKPNIDKCLFFIFSFSISFLMSAFFNPTILDKFILFEGGNDGLLYVHFSHIIMENISQYNFVEAFRGGESAYDLMPFYRYVWIINYLLFGEAPWMFLIILTLFPLIIYKLLRELIEKKWARIFLIFWFFLPLFEAFGFFHFYYVKLTLRGFAEPLSYLCFLSSLYLITKYYYKNNISKDNTSLVVYFFIGFLFSMTIGLRANILPACFIMTIFLIINFLKSRNFLKIFCLFLGLSPTLIIPYHNYFFTNKFIPLTIAAYKDWNLGIRPKDYYNFLKSVIEKNMDYKIAEKILEHLNGELKIYEIWYHIVILVNIYVLFSKKYDLLISFISLASLSMLSMMLFYHVGGRYSYLSWTLSLLVFSYVLKNQVFSNFRNKFLKNVT